ncbi:hypothetical protein Acr_08g0007320 [Actinidia rufa]|uniref:DUF7722 domain-containing protein n=1 Tax=Actinidia rufa TaxID=165716 RepID=A0A7J0F1I8_9ERIC|nr:hypothetical protein Acr_08g0007320 [Actinidia rufa]
MSGGGMESYARPSQKLGDGSSAEYETMSEWKLDCLLAEYGLPVAGDVTHKRKFAMGAFLWSH